ncbi:histidine phosphatase family protein [Bacillaceae bacterium]
MTLIYLVRHGETSWNRERRIQGQSDIPLNENGIEQAKRLARRFKDVPLAAIYTSDLLRAKKTAEIVAAFHGIVPVAFSDLRERKYGMWEGLTLQEIRLRYPGDDSVEIGGKYGIETLAEMQRRIAARLSMIARAHRGEAVMVVSHGSLINAFLHLISSGKWGTGVTKLGNTSVSLVENKGEGWKLHLVNDCSHLP